ncbi:MAG: hypothetical protein KKH98_08515, partial [Spirochaetes bacterium]|nr:hypothetical protein [Spirochaetota bacterium]
IYKGEFPKVEMYFPEINTTIEFFSIFIPGDIKNSSLPSIFLKVRGSGQMIFFLPSIYDSIPVYKKKRVILKSKEGEIGLDSKNGKTFFVPQDLKHFYVPDAEKLKDIFDKQDSYSIKELDHGKDKYYAGVFWKGEFEDEVLISWHYPDMRDLKNVFIGHYYSRFFKNVNSIIDYTLANKIDLQKKIRGFHRNIFDARQPSYLKDAYSAQLSSFVKQSWFSKKGQFGVWEGSCLCCGLQTTDVSYYGSWLYVRLFPELERTGIQLTAKFQRRDGWIPHFFPGTFSHIDEYRRKDMNMQFVLMVFRNYRIWNDNDFLIKIYQSVKKAVLGSLKWDNDSDHIPDIEGPDQTFDSWGWKGCSIYLATLQLASLKASSEIAHILKDKNFKVICDKEYAIVRKNIIKKLWNGTHFDLWVHKGKKDEGSLLDALSGDWYLRLLGIGSILPEHMVRSHLKRCWKYNRKKFDPEIMKAYSTPGEKGHCYINGGYKDNKKLCFQQYEPWTGIEYSYALHLYLTGMKRKAFRVIRDVHERKKKCGMVWNHIECGGDYFRPMVIGAFWDLIAAKKIIINR